MNDKVVEWSYIALYEALAAVNSTATFSSEDQAKRAFQQVADTFRKSTMEDNRPKPQSVADSFAKAKEADRILSIKKHKEDHPHEVFLRRAESQALDMLDSDEIKVKHTRAEIAGNPKEFSNEVLVVELRAIAAQQMQVGRTNKLRTHFERIAAELRRRGLSNNGERLS